MTESPLDRRMPSELGNAALALARAGLAVFPCWPRGKTPLTTNGHLDATCDEAAICAWWRRWPNANIGVATGAPSSLTVVDVDGDEGERLFARLEERFGTLPPTAESTTGKGRHLWYAVPEGSVQFLLARGKGSIFAAMAVTSSRRRAFTRMADDTVGRHVGAAIRRSAAMAPDFARDWRSS